MDAFNQLVSRFTKVWTSATLGGRVMTIIAGVIVLVTVVGAAVWSAMPDYKLLRDGISPMATANIVSALNSNGIPNRMNYSGTGVLVPASRWNDANITISEISDVMPSNQRPDGQNSIFPTRASHSDSVRAKGTALERSLESLRVVKSADVHLAIPEPSPFRSQRQPPSASVIIEPKINQIISQDVALSIIHTVAAAVEGLDPSNVTLTDANGNFAGSNKSNDPAAVRRDYVADVESHLAMKAQDLLAAVLGPNRSVVRVTAQVDDFLDKVTTKQAINAADKVRLVEKITSSDQKGLAASSGGVAGTASNDPTGLVSNANADQNISGKSETNETTYDYPRETEEIHEIGGQIVRLSVSATVDATRADAADPPDPANPAALMLTQEQVEGIIKSAVGFSDTRGDQLQVVMTQFTESPSLTLGTAIPEAEKWEFVSQLARNSSLGLAAIVALLLGMMTLKKLKPIEIPSSKESNSRSEVLSKLSSRVEDNPEAVSKILAAWIGQDADSENDPANLAKKAA